MIHSIRYSCAMGSLQETTCSNTAGKTTCHKNKRAAADLKAVLKQLNRSSFNRHISFNINSLCKGEIKKYSIVMMH